MKKLFFCLIFLLIPNVTFGAISFVTGLARQHGNLTVNTSALSCSGGDFLVVSVLENGIGTNNNTVTGVTYNGVPMTKVIDAVNNNNSDINLQLYVLHAPTSGINNLVISQTTNTSILYSAGCYLGVNQSSTVDASSLAQINGGGDQTVNITTLSDNDWLIMSFVTDVVESDSLINAVVRNGDPLELDYSISDSNGAKSPAGNYTIGYHAPSTDRGLIVAIAIKPALIDAIPPIVTVPADISAVATSTSGVSVAFSATADDEVDGAITPTCMPASSTLFAIGTTTVACGAIDVAGNTATSTFQVIVGKLTPTLVWATPASISYGTALSGMQLNATTTENISGTFIYTPALGVIVNASSTQTLRGNFIPTDTSIYNSASTEVWIIVEKANLDVTADDKTMTQGESDPVFTISYSGFVNSENAIVLTFLPAASVSGTHTNAGTYSIIPTGDSADNYNLIYHNGTLTVLPLPTSPSSSGNGPPVGVMGNVTIKNTLNISNIIEEINIMGTTSPPLVLVATGSPVLARNSVSVIPAEELDEVVLAEELTPEPLEQERNRDSVTANVLSSGVGSAGEGWFARSIPMLKAIFRFVFLHF